MSPDAEPQSAEPVAWRYISDAPKAKWTVQKNRPTEVEQWCSYTVEPLYTESDLLIERQAREAAECALEELSHAHDLERSRACNAEARAEASLAKAEARIAELEADKTRLNRLATDRQYMMTAYRDMLGEAGLKVAAMWDERGIKRVHFSWTSKAGELTGEERAQFILDVEEAVKSARPVESIDGPTILSSINKEPSHG